MFPPSPVATTDKWAVKGLAVALFSPAFRAVGMVVVVLVFAF